jgi:hypothetical protein
MESWTPRQAHASPHYQGASQVKKRVVGGVTYLPVYPAYKELKILGYLGYYIITKIKF